MMVIEAAGQRLHQRGMLSLHPAARQAGQHPRGTLAGESGGLPGEVP